MRENLFLNLENQRTRKPLNYFGIFGTALEILFLTVFLIGCTKDGQQDQPGTDPLIASVIAETIPANLSDAVVINPVVAVTFKSTGDLSGASLTLKSGTIPVEGTASISGTTFIFTPLVDLKPDTKYTATITTSKNGSSGNNVKEHSWSFTTGKKRDDNSLSFISVLPLNGVTSVAVDIKPSITFNKEMTSAITKLVTISLSRGTTPVSVTITYTGKTATLIPNENLTANTVYTGMVVIGKSENDDKNNSAKNFTWNFTTAGGGTDVTPPTVLSVVPVSSATGVATSIHPAVTFSEAMMSSTITTATFILQQGATPVTGTISYSGTTATFTPSSSLTASTVYTGTITTGAKDAAGNSIASNYTWSFTTAATVVSFSTQVLPILQSKCMPCHGASSPSAGIPITNYATVSNLTNTQLDNSNMYPMKGVTAAEIATIRAWIAGGRLNN